MCIYIERCDCSRELWPAGFARSIYDFRIEGEGIVGRTEGFGGRNMGRSECCGLYTVGINLTYRGS